MRIYTDGAELGDTSFLDTVTGITASVVQQRSGLYSYESINNGDTIGKAFAAVSEGFWRWGIKNTGSAMPRLRLRSGGTSMASVQVNAGTGLFELYSGDTVLLVTSVVPLVINQWFLLEVNYKVADAGGYAEFKIDGVSQGNFSGDTKVGALATIDNWNYSPGASGASWWDDLAMNDTSNADGLNDNSWCGDGKIEYLRPNGNGYVSQWTGQDGNSVDNYLNVDDVPSDGDATYNENGTATNKDAYAITDWVGTNKIALRVWPEGRVRDTVAAGNQVKLGLRSGGADYMSGNLNLLTTYSRIVGTGYKTDPSDAAAWTDADIDALEAVIETV